MQNDAARNHSIHHGDCICFIYVFLQTRTLSAQEIELIEQTLLKQKRLH